MDKEVGSVLVVIVRGDTGRSLQHTNVVYTRVVKNEVYCRIVSETRRRTRKTTYCGTSDKRPS